VPLKGQEDLPGKNDSLKFADANVRFGVFRNFLAPKIMVAKDCNGSLVTYSIDAEFTDPDKISENGAEFTQSVEQFAAPDSVSLTL
jgi:hypothetical protein